MKEDNLKIHTYKSKFAFLGSCFSQNIHTALVQSDFQSQSNPFGTLFSPKAIEQFILNENNILFSESAFIQRENIVLNYHANAKVYGLNKKAYRTTLEELRNAFLNYLKTANILFLTFGTAWVYEEKSSSNIVANCHKVSQINFTKKMLDVSDIVAGQLKVIAELKRINPSLNIIYTVSPVRHKKDGLVENNRSKAKLFQSIEELERNAGVSYFMAYELIVDELRDYRFFEPDGVHPNALAIKAVSNLFFDQYLTSDTLQIRLELLKYKQQLAHKPIHPELLRAIETREKVRQAYLLFKKENGIK